MRDDYVAEASDEHVTKLDNVLYTIIALVDIKTSYYLSKTNEVWNRTRGWKKYTKCLRFFWYRNTRDILSNNNGNMIVGEIPEFVQFPRRDILFFYFVFFFFSSKAESILFKGNSSCNEKLLYYNFRNWSGFLASWLSVQRISVFDVPI